ncbi:MAG TPA: alpha/beta hydrolase [Candidatus Angelobacter sp.]|jgi:acetyl esterase/lipase|nr:alpha/beta hydrolase [Candidatus Angelobacter sp.]
MQFTRQKRIASLLLLQLLWLVSTTSPQSQPPAQEQRRNLSDLVNRPVVYSVSGPVKVTADIVYKKDATADFLKMDVFTPGDAHGPAPVVVFIHGGVPPNVPLHAKDWGIYKSWGKLVAASGMGAVTFNHRGSYPDPNLEQASQDVNDLVGFVRAHAQEWNLDGNRICLAAYSAGGPLLSMTMRETPAYVRCLVGFYPFLDLRESALHKKYMSEQQRNDFSPVVFLSRGPDKLPPIFIARAGRDQIQDLEPALDRFVAEAIHQNVALEFMNHPVGVHGFDNQNDDDRSREIIKTAVDFMKTHLQVK